MFFQNILRWIAGSIVVVFLEIIGRLPIRRAQASGSLLLPLYIPFRRKTRERLGKLTPPVSPLAYYRMRLRLSSLSLKHILGKPDGCEVLVEGAGLFANALISGKPVALLGWHQGPVELLHRIPAAAAPGRPFFVMTASAFSPALAEWMAHGRAAAGTTVIRPDDAVTLRTWVREKGVLAVMIDQVPGEPEDWMALQSGTISLPCPRRLLDWIAARDPECLAVSVHLEPGDRIVFRYDRIDSGSLKEGLARCMEEAISRTPEQYNWSYPKIRIE